MRRHRRRRVARLTLDRHSVVIPADERIRFGEISMMIAANNSTAPGREEGRDGEEKGAIERQSRETREGGWGGERASKLTLPSHSWTCPCRRCLQSSVEVQHRLHQTLGRASGPTK